MKYSPPLDGLRALCVTFTLLNHIPGHPDWLNGTVGVDGFFALSGFLITNLLSAEWNATGRLQVRSFYLRRAFRIVPLYYVVFALYGMTTLALHATGKEPERLAEWTAAAPAVLSFLGEYRPAAAGTLFGHSWTLGIEEKYYLLWPLVFVVLQALGPRSRLFTLAMLCVFAWILLDPAMEARGYGGLAIGSWFGMVYSDPLHVWRAQWLRVRAEFFVLLWCAAYALTVAVPGGEIHVLLTLASALLIGRVADAGGRLARLLSAPMLVYIGRRSYGIYLVHPLIANAGRLILARFAPAHTWLPVLLFTLAASTVLASVLKHLIEDPMIRLGKHLAASTASQLPAPEGAA